MKVRKKPPAIKHVSFCPAQLWMRGYAGLLFRTNRSDNKKFSRRLQHFGISGACPADAPWVLFSFFFVGPPWGVAGVVAGQSAHLLIPLRGEWVGWLGRGWCQCPFQSPPSPSTLVQPNTPEHLFKYNNVCRCFSASVIMSITQQSNTTRGGMLRIGVN